MLIDGLPQLYVFADCNEPITQILPDITPLAIGIRVAISMNQPRACADP